MTSCRQADEAREHCRACHGDVEEKRIDLANTKSEILAQLREMIAQCDLTLKSVRCPFCSEHVKQKGTHGCYCV